MDATPTSSTTLRPLGLGKLLDRAVNLCVKYLATFALIYAVFAIPMAVLQLAAAGDQTRSMNTLIQILQAQAAGQPAKLSPNLTNYPLFSGAFALLLAAWFFIYPLPKAALIVAASSAYLRGSADFKQAYETALGRWLPLVGLNVLYLLCGVTLYALAVFAALVVILVLGVLTAAVHSVGIALDVTVGLAAGVVLCAFGLVVALAYEVSAFTCVVESASPVQSLMRGVDRVFRGVGLRRSLVVGLAYVAVVFGIGLIVGAGAGVLFGFFHSVLVSQIFSTLVSLGTAAFITTFMGIFYFDLRVREEGFDLQLAAAAIEPRPAAST